MSQDTNTQLVSKKAIVFDLILTGIFFYYMFGVMEGHVPFEDTQMHFFASAYSAACITGVFWMAVQCLRVTCVDHILKNKTQTPR